MRRMPYAATLLLMAALALLPGVAGAMAQGPDPWAPFQFLVGAWSGLGSGKPGEAVSGKTSFVFQLDKNVLVRNNRAEYAPKPGETKGTVHEDLMIIYRDSGGQGFRAVYFDNEGHVIRYAVSFPARQPSAVFESEASGSAPRFKLVYELAADGTLSIDFLVAPPGGEFKSYVKGSARKAG